MAFDADTTVLGDTIYFQYIYTNLTTTSSWVPKIRIYKYFKNNITSVILKKIMQRGYLNPSYYQLRDKRFVPINDDLYHLFTGGYGIVFKLDNYVIKFVFEDNKKYNPMELTSEYTVPRFLYTNLQGDEKKLIVCAIAMGINFNLTFLRKAYVNTFNLLSALFSLLENDTITTKYSYKRILSYFNRYKYSRDFIKLITRFYPSVVKSNINIINNFNTLIDFFENDKRSQYMFDRGNIIIFPLAKFSADKISPRNCAEYGFIDIIEYIKFMFLQMALLYIKIYELPFDNFIHLDLKPDNILIFDSPESLNIIVDDIRYTFNESIKCMLNDFDFSYISTILPNKKTSSHITSLEHNWYYDFHFFVHILFKTYPEINKDIAFSSLLRELMIGCNRSTCEKARLKVKKVPPIAFLVNIIKHDVFSRWINDGTSRN